MISPTGYWAAVAAVLIVAALAKRKHAWRWLSGRHSIWEDMPRTDANFFRRGRREIGVTRAGWWHWRPGWQRTAIRLGVLGVLAVGGYGWLYARATLVASLVGLAGCVLVASLVAVALVARRWSHTRRYVRPLATTLGPILGYPRGSSGWLDVRPGFARDGAATVITLPDGWSGDAEGKRTIVRVVGEKLGAELDPAWSHVGRPSVTFTPVPRPPKRVGFEDVRELVVKAPESAPVIGLGKRSEVISADYDADSAHLLISAGSGGGKSVLARAQAAQILHNGGLGLVLDLKRISHAWAKGLPNVKYARSVEEIHDALIALSAEVDRRNILVDEYADDDGNIDPAKIGPRLFVIAEEMNATINRLNEYWRTIRESEDPKTSPAVQALGDTLFMGRAVLVNVCAIAQMMTARTLGGPEARENFAVRVLARYTLNSARMLAPEVWPFPKSSRHRGRAQVVYGGEAHETQVVFWTPAECREWAMSGRVSQWSTGPSESDYQAEQGGTVPGLRLAPEPGAPEPVGLAEAAEGGIVSVSLDSLRAARKRDDEFPPAVGKRGAELLYDPDALARWERNRPRAGKVSGE